MSITKKKGRPHYHYDFQIAGQRFSGSTGKTSLHEAEQFEKKKRTTVEALLASGRVSKKDITISDAFARYWVDHAHKLPSADSIASRIKLILEAIGETKLFADICNDDIAAFVAFRRARGKCVLRHIGGERIRVLDVDGKRQYQRTGGRIELVRIGEVSDASILMDLNIWRAVHNLARDLWELDVRPIAWRKIRPDAPEKRISSIPLADVERLAQHLPRHIMLAAIFTLMTGSRFGQTAGVQNKHINWAARTVDVKRQKRKSKNGAWVAETKQLIGPAFECLQLACVDRSSIDPEAYIFDFTNFPREWRRARQAAGLPGFRFHDLRHVIATWLVKNGTPIQVVSNILGHSDIKVTMRYAEVDGSDARAALAALPNFNVPRQLTAEKKLASGGRQ